MNQAQIIYPMAALALLTFLVLGMIPVRRFRAAKQGLVKRGDFKYGESGSVPGEVSIPNRNYMNLLEMPMLFYVACVAFYVTGTVDPVSLTLAWLYVALRAAHSVVHLTYNKVFHRLGVFAVGNVVLATLWIRLVVSLAQ